jgi:hypothetical protein
LTQKCIPNPGSAKNRKILLKLPFTFKASFDNYSKSDKNHVTFCSPKHCKEINTDKLAAFLSQAPTSHEEEHQPLAWHLL